MLSSAFWYLPNWSTGVVSMQHKKHKNTEKYLEMIPYTRSGLNLNEKHQLFNVKLLMLAG